MEISLKVLRFEKMIDLNKMLTKRCSHDRTIIAYCSSPVDAQRHMLVICIDYVAHVFVCDILLREGKIFRLVSYQKIAC